MAKALKIFQDHTAGIALDDIQVAAPCPANWADMVGSDKVRFCASCQKNVYNLSGMKREEAVDLLRATEGRVCARFFRRADGTVLTEDCPVGVALLLRRARRATLAAAAVSLGAVAAVLATLGGVLGGGMTRRACARVDELKQVVEQQSLSPAEPPGPVRVVMGDMAFPPSPEVEPPSDPPSNPRHIQDPSLDGSITGRLMAPAPRNPIMGEAAVRPHELKGKPVLRQRSR